MGSKYKLKETLRLSLSLAKATFRLRIEGSYLGILWYLLNPLFLFLVFMMIRQSSSLATGVMFYPLYLFLGIAAFNFFRATISAAIASISNNPNYIKSTNMVSPESLVGAAVLQHIFAHLFEFLIISFLVFYFSLSAVGLFYYLLAFSCFIIMVIGLALIFAIVGVYVSDLENVWAIVSQLLLLGTPIFYSASSNSLIYKLNFFNPLFYFLETSRSLLIYGRLPETNILLIFLISAPLIFFLGVFVFKRYKYKMAELI
ncbi:ABC transporter permease [Candidatus Falkowbacteria bacterium]|nr:ABC transporter permease [Candidatus Falkowbacteria bacterium]